MNNDCRSQTWGSVTKLFCGSLQGVEFTVDTCCKNTGHIFTLTDIIVLNVYIIFHLNCGCVSPAGSDWCRQTPYSGWGKHWSWSEHWTLWEINWFTAEQEAVAANKQQYKHGQSERGFIVNTEEWPRTSSYWYQINIAPGLFILILIHGISTLDSKEEGTINVEIDFSMRL